MPEDIGNAKAVSKDNRNGIILSLVGGTAWGLSGSCSQYLFSYSAIEPRTVTIYRLMGSGLLLMLINLLTNRRRMTEVFRKPGTVMHLIVYAIFGVGLCQLSYLSAIKYSNSGTATVLQSSGIILVFIVTCMMERKAPHIKELSCLLLIMAGVFLLATHGNVKQLVLSREGLFWGAMAALAVALYTLLPGSMMKRFGTSMVLGYAMFIGGIVLFLISPGQRAITDTRPVTILCILFIIAVGTALAFTLYLKGVQLCGPEKASMLSCAEPIVATLTSWLLLGTQFAPMDFAGFFLAILGVVLLSRD